MIVTFKTKAYANIIMFGDIAQALLKMMGHTGTVPGAILADDIPAALARLIARLDSAKTTSVNEESEDEVPVSLHNRALPLIELLNAAIKRHADVMWE